LSSLPATYSGLLWEYLVFCALYRVSDVARYVHVIVLYELH